MGLADFGGVTGSRIVPLPCPLGDVRSLDDRECASPLLSRIASALVGDFSVLGTASSSIVLPRDREGVEVSVRLRMVMPWRCRSLRFCASQHRPISLVTRCLHAHMATARAAPSVEKCRPRRLPATAGPYYVACLALDAACAHNSNLRFLTRTCFVLPAGAVTDSLPHCMFRYRRVGRAWWSCRGGAAVQPFPRRLGPFGAPTSNLLTWAASTYDSIGIAPAHAAMPRSLSRLRYRTPPSAARPQGSLAARVTAYVAGQSKPRHIRLQVFANPKARRPATGQTTIAPYKPFTLRDVVDPDGKAQHGEIIYIFRHNRTNQIIYSLQELLNVGSHVRLTTPYTYSFDTRTTTSHSCLSLASTPHPPSSDRTIGHHTASSPSPLPSRATMRIESCASSGSCTSCRGTRPTLSGSMRL
jgi:hypothetical protein